MKKRLLYILPLFLIAAYALEGLAQEPLEVEKLLGTPGVLVRTLDNGLTVAIQENHAVPVVAVYAYVKNTGSINEGQYMGSGISHYVEHLVLGGTTTRRTAEEADQIVWKIGAQDNAYTTKNVTGYHMAVLSKWFDTAVDLVSDWIMNSAFKAEEVAGERKVILKEIDMDGDDPDTVLYTAFMEKMFRVHNRRYPIIGFRENLARLTREDLLKFYREKYIPDNVVFVVVGDIESEKALIKVKEAFKEFKRKPVIRFPIPEEPPQVSVRYVEKLVPVNVPRIMMGYHTVGLLHEDLYPLDIAAYILGKGRSARLLKEVVYNKGLAADISVDSETPFNGAGSFVAAADLVEGAAIESATAAITEVIEALKTELVTANELSRAKAQKISDHVYEQTDVEDQAEMIGWDIISTGDPEFSRRYLKNIQKVTRADIRRVARKYFNRENLTVGILRSPETASVQPPKKRKTFWKPETKKFKLENGIRLLVQENRANQSVAVRAYFQGGLRFSKGARAGVFPLLAQMFLRGTKSRSADRLAAEIEDMGGGISAYSGDNSFGVSLDLISGSEEKGIEILADIILNPALTAQELEKERVILKKRIESREDNWLREVYDLYRSEYFKKHPYGLPPRGSIKAVENLSLADVHDTYRRFCLPGNLVIAVFGDVHTDKVVSKVVEAFSVMKAKDLQVKPPERERAPEKKRVFSKAVAKKQVAIALGYKGIDLRSQDRYALDVIDALVSGIRTSGGWLFDALRGGEVSYVYFIHATNWIGVDPGSFYVITQSSPENKDTVTEIIYGVFKRLYSGEIDEKELDAAKETCITADRIYYQTNGDQAGRALHNELYGLGFDFHLRYEQRIRRVSLEDIKAAAEKYLKSPAVEVWTYPKKN